MMEIVIVLTFCLFIFNIVLLIHFGFVTHDVLLVLIFTSFIALVHSLSCS